MHPYSTVSPITQRLVQVHAIVDQIAGVNGPLHTNVALNCFILHQVVYFCLLHAHFSLLL